MWLRRVLMATAGDGQQGGAGASAGAGTGTGTGDKGAAGDQGAAGTGTGDKGAGDAQLDAKVGLWPENWRTQLAGDDVKALKRLERFAAPTDIYRSYRALEQRLSTGELKSTLPKDATAEQKAAWRAESGIPETPDKYDLNLGDGLVVGENDKPMVEAFTKAAHEVDMHPTQVKRVLTWYYDFAEKQAAAQAAKDAAAVETGIETLRGEWGTEYKPNLNRITSLLDMAPAGVKDQMMGGRLADGTPFMSDPKTLEWLVSLARELNPASTVIPNIGVNAGALAQVSVRGKQLAVKVVQPPFVRNGKILIN